MGFKKISKSNILHQEILDGPLYLDIYCNNLQVHQSPHRQLIHQWSKHEMTFIVAIQFKYAYLY